MVVMPSSVPAPVPMTTEQPFIDPPEDTPFADSATFHFIQSTPPDPVILDEYPALVVLKTGGVYSVTKYWVKAKNLYFLTPAGETLYVPLGRLDRVYPPVKQDKVDRK